MPTRGPPANPLEYAVFVFDVTGPPPPTGNLVGNADFEIDTSGWGTAGSGTGVTLGRSQPGHLSSWAALLTNTSSGTRKCSLNDGPNWVTTTQSGTYAGSIWVDTAGKTIEYAFKEMNGSTQVKAKTVTYTTTTSWQQLSVTLAPNSPGTTTLDFQVFLPKAQAPPGVCFHADDAWIRCPDLASSASPPSGQERALSEASTSSRCSPRCDARRPYRGLSGSFGQRRSAGRRATRASVSSAMRNASRAASSSR